ncbi:hypothetical protein ACIBAI_28375 [Streptomyces sp. NPDC051041]|uniref:hypothetical protein n=1 Tax=Streptomyces sp. NPDC051041 TaxID=3365640 RepID=UPI00378D2257
MTPVAFTGSAVRPAREDLPRTAVRPRRRNHVPTRTAPAGASAHRGTAPAARGEAGGRSAPPRRAAAPHRYEVFPRPGAGSPGELRPTLRRGGDPR